MFFSNRFHLFAINIELNMSNNKKYQIEDSSPSVISEPAATYCVSNEVDIYLKEVSNSDMASAIDGKELLNRLRPRIKSLFE